MSSDVDPITTSRYALMQMLTEDDDGSTRWILAENALDAYRDEVLREAAAKIRKFRVYSPGDAEYTVGITTLFRTADLIDPDVT